MLATTTFLPCRPHPCCRCTFVTHGRRMGEHKNGCNGSTVESGDSLFRPSPLEESLLIRHLIKASYVLLLPQIIQGGPSFGRNMLGLQAPSVMINESTVSPSS